MKNVLISVLGAGQGNLVPESSGRIPYRRTRYQLGDGDQPAFETAFIGEAILRLEQSPAFDGAVIMGTAQSMWDVLYAHCMTTLKNQNEADVKSWEILQSKVQDNVLKDDDLASLNKLLSQMIGIPIQCRIIQTGGSVAELWEIFEAISDIPEAGQTISMDITLGLRYQPFFLLLALQYLTFVRESVTIGKIYNGALELRTEGKEGVTPILELSPMIDMMEWTNAASAFRKSGNLIPLLDLSEQANADPAFLDAGDAFSSATELSMLYPKKLKASAAAFFEQLEKLKAEKTLALRPLKLLAKDLQRFPKEMMENEQDWQVLLTYAGKIAKIPSQLGIAILSAWEALLTRLAQVYEVDPTDMEVYGTLRRIANHKDFKKMEGYLESFPKMARDLNTMRNIVAHRKAVSFFTPGEVSRKFPDILAYFALMLPNPRLEKLPELMPFRKYVQKGRGNWKGGKRKKNQK